MMRKQEIIGGIPIEITKKSNLKNFYIRVIPPKGNITVSVPVEVTDEEIKLFVLKKIPEITRVRNRMIDQVRQTKREYISGESHYLWGKPYRLQVVYSDKVKCKIEKTPTKIIMIVPKGCNTEYKEKKFNEWYRCELKRVLQIMINQCENKMCVHADEYRIKNMKTRWGTCNIEKRRIWINLQLVKKPLECLEYVLTHEMVHLLERDHTHRFQALVEEYCPMWKESKKILSSMPLDYLEKGE